MPAARAIRLFENKRLFADGAIIHVRVLLTPAPVEGSTHRFKYALYYGRPGERIVLYDNERGKGDHRHYGEREEPYAFTSVRRLVADFLADVTRIRGD